MNRKSFKEKTGHWWGESGKHSPISGTQMPFTLPSVANYPGSSERKRVSWTAPSLVLGRPSFLQAQALVRDPWCTSQEEGNPGHKYCCRNPMLTCNALYCSICFRLVKIWLLTGNSHLSAMTVLVTGPFQKCKRGDERNSWCCSNNIFLADGDQG